MVILEFYYFSAVYADEVIVGGFFEEVWIVSGSVSYTHLTLPTKRIV